MTRKIIYKHRYCAPWFNPLTLPLCNILHAAPRLESRGNRPLQMNFDYQLNALIFFHLQEYTSARELIQVLKEDDFARNTIAPEEGISRSSFSVAINGHGLEQFLYVFQELQKQAGAVLPKKYSHLDDLISIDGSLIDTVLSMAWADYRKKSKKASLYLGFNVNQGIPQKLFLTDGKGAERPFVHQILDAGQTGILDRGYQDHQNFDSLREEQKHFVCRIKGNTHKICLEEYDVDPDSIVFYDAKVLLGQSGEKQTRKPLCLIGYIIDDVKYWVATDRFDLTAEDIALIYKLRWETENLAPEPDNLGPQ